MFWLLEQYASSMRQAAGEFVRVAFVNEKTELGNSKHGTLVLVLYTTPSCQGDGRLGCVMTRVFNLIPAQSLYCLH
jgi:hypothetical protein